MRLVVDPSVVETYPDLRIGVMLAHDIDNRGVDDHLQTLKRCAARRFAEAWTNERLSAQPQIVAWREAYRSFGVKPSTSRPTAESFLRRLIRGDPFPTISKAVDAYLLAETQHYLPVGGYDVDMTIAPIMLRRSPGGETFRPIAATEEEVTAPGEVVYADDARVLTRKWNFRDCDECKITQRTRNIALFTEAPFATVSTEKLRAALESIANNVAEFCGGHVVTELVYCAERRVVDLTQGGA